MDLETTIGAVWFNRLGLAALVIAFALLATYVTPRLSPAFKLGGSFLLDGLLFGAGWWFRDRLKLFARPVMAGALAIAFFLGYAGHFVDAMACLPLAAALALMTLAMVGVLACADRWESSATAAFAILLGHIAAFIAGGRADAFSLIAILFLCFVPALLFRRHNWTGLNLFAVIAAYVSHLLWALQEHPLVSVEVRFWANFAFLTAYYLIFTAVALTFYRRLHAGAAFPAVTRLYGRGIGPAALILYPALTTVLFYATDIYADVIHRYLFPLALAQFAVAWCCRRWRENDGGIYTAAGVTFATLALIAKFDGLALNLVLAGEALLLLVLARRLRFWLLNLLAQLVLGVNFIHFWLSQASHISSWATFSGAMATALVYFVKARLEETWQAAPPAPGRLTTALNAVMDRMVLPLSYLHAFLGCILFVYNCHSGFFTATCLPFPPALGTLALFIAVLLLRSCPLAVAAWLLAAQTVFTLVTFNLDPHTAAEGIFIWTVSRWLLLGFAVLGLIALRQARRTARPFFLMFAQTWFIIIAAGALLSGGCGTPRAETYAVALLLPLVFWVIAERWRETIPAPAAVMSGRWHDILEEVARRLTPYLAAAAAPLGALLLHVITATVFANRQQVLFLISMLPWPFLVAALLRRSRNLLFGVLAAYALNTAYLAWHALTLATPPAPADSFAALLAIVGAVGGGVFFAATARSAGRLSFLNGSLVALLCGMVMLAILLNRGGWSFVPLPGWFAAAGACWLVIERFRRECTLPARLACWRKQHGDAGFFTAATRVACGFSLLGAVLLYWLIDAAHFVAPVPDWLYLALFAAMALLAGLLRSPSLAVAGGYFALHTVWAAQQQSANGSKWPFFAASAAGLLLLCGALPEWRYWQRRRAGGESLPLAAGILYCYLLMLSALTAAVAIVTGPLLHDGLLFGPACLGLALALALAAMPFRFGLLQIVLLAFAGWLALRFIIIDAVEVQAIAGLCFAFGYLLFERLLTLQPRAVLAFLDASAHRFLTTLLTLITGLFTTLVIYRADLFHPAYVTFGWAVAAFIFAGCGIWWEAAPWRRLGLALFALALLRALLVDIWRLETLYRIIAFFGLGICLIAVSFLYTRFRDKINRWL